MQAVMSTPVLAPKPRITDTKLIVGQPYSSSTGEELVFIGENPHAKLYPILFTDPKSGEIVSFTRALYRKGDEGEHISIIGFKKPRVTEERWFNVVDGEILRGSYKSREWADSKATEDRTGCFGFRLIMELNDGKWQIMSKEFLE